MTKLLQYDSQRLIRQTDFYVKPKIWTLFFIFFFQSQIYASKRFQDDWRQDRETILQTFLDFISSNNNDIFRELLANNTTHFSRIYIKQC